jgi:hypothetical protein
MTTRPERDAGFLRGAGAGEEEQQEDRAKTHG